MNAELDRVQHQQNLLSDEIHRLACRIAELEKQITELKGNQ